MARSHRRRGSQIVEFALLAPVLVAFLGVQVDAGLYFASYIQVVDCANAGARAVSNLTPAPTSVNRFATASREVITDLLTTPKTDGGPGYNSADVTVSSTIQYYASAPYVDTTTTVVYKKIFPTSPVPSAVSTFNSYRVAP